MGKLLEYDMLYKMMLVDDGDLGIWEEGAICSH